MVAKYEKASTCLKQKLYMTSNNFDFRKNKIISHTVAVLLGSFVFKKVTKKDYVIF